MELTNRFELTKVLEKKDEDAVEVRFVGKAELVPRLDLDAMSNHDQL